MENKPLKLAQRSELVNWFPSPASPGRAGRPSRVVWCQSHAGKLDWRVHRLQLRFQAQGESKLPSRFSLFIHSSFSLLFNLSTFFHQVFPRCSRFPASVSHLFVPEQWLLTSLWIFLFIYAFLFEIMHQNIKMSALLFTSSGGIHRQEAICPNRWRHKLVYIEFSKSHINGSS